MFLTKARHHHASILGVFFRPAKRQMTTSNTRYTYQLPPRTIVKDDDLEEAFLKGSGPGGQKINKTSSAVQLKHIPTGMVVKSQATRSRSQNRKIARRLLAEKLEEAEKGPESRTALKAEIKRKKKASKTKKSKRKYRNAADGKDGDKDTEEDQEVEENGRKAASTPEDRV